MANGKPNREFAPVQFARRVRRANIDEPLPRRYNSTPYAPLAQGIEQLPSKQWVAGSNPAGGAMPEPIRIDVWSDYN